MDIELAMPKHYRRQTGTVVRRDRIHLDRETGTFWKMLENVQVAIEGAMLTRSAVINAGNSLVREFVITSWYPDGSGWIRMDPFH